MAKKQRQGNSAERAKRHIIKVMNDSTDNTVASETSTEDDASSAVVAVADALTIQKETNHLNALEEGLMGSNSSLASIDHFGVDGGYCPYDSTSQNSTNSQQSNEFGKILESYLSGTVNIFTKGDESVILQYKKEGRLINQH